MTIRTLTQSLNDAVKLIKQQTGSQVDAKCDMSLLKNGDVRVKLNMLVKEPKGGLDDFLRKHSSITDEVDQA